MATDQAEKELIWKGLQKSMTRLSRFHLAVVIKRTAGGRYFPLQAGFNVADYIAYKISKTIRHSTRCCRCLKTITRSKRFAVIACVHRKFSSEDLIKGFNKL